MENSHLRNSLKIKKEFLNFLVNQTLGKKNEKHQTQPEGGLDRMVGLMSSRLWRFCCPLYYDSF
jgi:hypothetical protein